MNLPDDILGNIRRGVSDYQQLRGAELALDRKLVSLEQLDRARGSGKAPLDALVTAGALTREQADDLLQDLDAQDTDRFDTVPRLMRYKRGRKLGEGGMAVVYEAMDKELGRPVALKILKNNPFLHESARQRFRREAKVIASISHPNIVTVHDMGEAKGRPFMVMELMEGNSFADAMKEMSRKERLTVLEKVATGVAAAHEKGIVHRDLKPSNILLNREGDPKVADFGLAYWVESTTELTKTGVLMGTPLYMAPEQIEGATIDVKPGTDVYALGVILFEILIGATPFRGGSPSEVYGKILRLEPPSLRERDRSIDPPLERIYLQAMQRDPAHRYANAGEFAADLRRYLRGETVQARPPSPLGKAIARRKVPLFLGAVVLLGALVGAAMLLTTEQRLREAELFVPIEKDLELLLMKSYLPDFRMTDADFADYEALIDRIRGIGESPRGWYLIGRCRELLADWDRAEASYDRALALDPEHGPSLFGKGRIGIERALFRPVDAKGGTRKSSSDEARKALARIRAAGDYEMEADLAEAYVLMLSHKKVAEFGDRMILKWKGSPFSEEFLLLGGQNSSLEDQIRRADEVIAKRPSWARAHTFRGKAVMQLGDRVDEAIADFDRALDINPRDALALLFRGECRSLKGDYEPAIADFEAAVRFQPNNPVAVFMIGEARKRMGDWEGAIREYDRSLRMDPRFETAHLNRGVALGQLGKFEEEVRAYSEAIRLNPGWAVPWFNRGNAQRDRGDEDAATKDYEKAIELDPDFREPYMNRGDLRQQQKNLEGALADFGEAIRISPQHAAAWSNHGNVYFDMRKLDLALEDYEKALALDPKHARAWYGRGNVRRLNGDWRGAFEDYEESLKCEPTFLLARVNRAACRFSLGDTPGGIRDLEETLRMAPADWKHRKRYEKILKDLKK